MKVLMPVLHYFPVIGGLETWTRNIAEGVSDKAQVFVVAGRVKGRPSRENIKGVEIFRTSLFSLKDLSHSSFFYILASLKSIFLKSLVLIKKEKIDILHCQGFLSSFLGMCLSFLTGIPYVATVQRIEKRKGFLRRLAYRRACLCIAASSAIAEYFKDIGVEEVEIIPNGIDLERFKGLEPVAHRGFLVMTVARLEKVKGVRFLIEASKKLNSSIPGFKLVVVGGGSQRKNLEKLASDLGLGEKVKFTGPLPSEKIPSCLALADCFVLPSLSEGFGIAILEAQAAGVPVVASRIGGITDIIQEGETGLLAEPGKVQDIVGGVLKVHSDRAFSQNLAKRAKIKLQDYKWENICQKVFEIYEKCAFHGSDRL